MAQRVLVVEDNPLNLKLVRDVLEHAGYEVHAAPNGEEGVELASSVSPDLVLLDLQLPGIDGSETLLRMRDAGVRVPVVAVTAFAMAQDRDRAMDSGFDGYLEKPISSRALPHQVAAYLAARSP